MWRLSGESSVTVTYTDWFWAARKHFDADATLCPQHRIDQPDEGCMSGFLQRQDSTGCENAPGFKG